MDLLAVMPQQLVFGIALGYENLNDHDELRHDPMMAVLAGKLGARREDCAPVAGKSTLNNTVCGLVRAWREGLAVQEIPIQLQEKRQPSINLWRRVPNVLKNMARLTYVIRIKNR